MRTAALPAQAPAEPDANAERRGPPHSRFVELIDSLCDHEGIPLLDEEE